MTPPALRFLGAAGTVTGSRFLLEFGAHNVLVDCGLYQGLKALRLKNWEPWPFDLAKLDAVILTHAHVDHSGYLPRLYKLGYRGPVYCSGGTAALLDLLLPDAAHLQVEEAQYANRKGYSKHHPAEPLYTVADARGALSLLRSVAYRTTVSPFAGVEASLHPAGHLLGSSSVLLQWDASGSSRRLLVSGDLGKYDDAFMADPRAPEMRTDYLLIESTYGDRRHDDGVLEERLAQIVGQAVEAGGVLLVPAFAVGRTQEVLFHLSRLERAARIPVLDVYVDSPMACDATYTYFLHREDLNLDWSDRTHALKTERTRFVRSVAESKALRNVTSRAIIISASGMATGGRVVHHLSQRVGDARNTVLFAGFQVDGTRGRKLVDGAQTIRMFGQDWPVRARIEDFRAFSAHGDRDDLLRWARSLGAAPRATWVVHGEPRAAESLRESLRHELGHRAETARLGERVALE
jgi:metallo-beta-lactamase family protein